VDRPTGVNRPCRAGFLESEVAWEMSTRRTAIRFAAIPGRLRAFLPSCALIVAVLHSSLLFANPALEPGLELFEKRIRPLLINRCYKCHAKGEDSKSGLRMDARASLLEGGMRGPAIVPGEPEESLLIRAVRQEGNTSDGGLPTSTDDRNAKVPRMPPGKRLSSEEISDLVQWVSLGAPWPSSEDYAAAEQSPPTSAEESDVVVAVPDGWAFEPLSKPSIPDVNDDSWCQTPIDRFVLARLEAAGLSSSPPAEKHTLIRRATYDLIGLPPTPEEVQDFLEDDSPQAFAKVVDRLLASPHYGERWGRHWLDVVRYAETDGHEFDPDKPGAYLYRDYVVDAFNRDLPYDQFIAEQLAGDLLQQPRLSTDKSYRASEVATAFYWLGEIQNVPVDQAAADANVVENQIDVIGKAFLGLTVACARCHDHKFDPIAGILYSSQPSDECLDSIQKARRTSALCQEIADLNQRIHRLEAKGRLEARLPQLERMADYLLAVRELRLQGIDEPATTDRSSFERIARQYGIDVEELIEWQQWLSDVIERKEPIFYPWARLLDVDPDRFDPTRRALAERLESRLSKAEQASTATSNAESQLYDDFEHDGLREWRAVGPAFRVVSLDELPAVVTGVQGSACVSSMAPSGNLTSCSVSPAETISAAFASP